jgi:hypothetical protein
MRVAYVGNFQPEHSTENHVRRALESLDVEVVPLQESERDWDNLKADTRGADFMLWTRTAGFDPSDLDAQWLAVKSLDIPTVGYHLDRFWGITGDHRQYAIPKSVFFHQDLLCTADGGHQQEWGDAEINHHWYPPAILREEAEIGEALTVWKADVCFVGNLTTYGHVEWAPYRKQLYKYLSTKYRRNRFRVFPGGRQPGIRGKALQDLYASVKVVVGDSCLSGGVERYWSDRIPETTGRGGFLIHPAVVGLSDEYPHLVTYRLDDFADLGEKIDRYLEDDEERRRVATMGREWVLGGHTYQHRMVRLLQEVKQL